MNSTSPCLPGSLPKAEWSAKTERFASWKAMGGNGKLLDVEGHWVRKEDQEWLSSLHLHKCKQEFDNTNSGFFSNCANHFFLNQTESVIVFNFPVEAIRFGGFLLRHSLRAQGSEAGRGRRGGLGMEDGSGTAILMARLCYFPLVCAPFLKVPC